MKSYYMKQEAKTKRVFLISVLDFYVASPLVKQSKRRNVFLFISVWKQRARIVDNFFF